MFAKQDLNTTLKVPGVGFSVAGLDHAKFRLLSISKFSEWYRFFYQKLRLCFSSIRSHRKWSVIKIIMTINEAFCTELRVSETPDSLSILI